MYGVYFLSLTLSCDINSSRSSRLLLSEKPIRCTPPYLLFINLLYFGNEVCFCYFVVLYYFCKNTPGREKLKSSNSVENPEKKTSQMYRPHFGVEQMVIIAVQYAEILPTSRQPRLSIIWCVVKNTAINVLRFVFVADVP